MRVAYQHGLRVLSLIVPHDKRACVEPVGHHSRTCVAYVDHRGGARNAELGPRGEEELLLARRNEDLNSPHVLGVLRPRVSVDGEPPDFPGLEAVGGGGQVPGVPKLVVGQWRFSVPWWVTSLQSVDEMVLWMRWSRRSGSEGCPAALCGFFLPGLWSAESPALSSCSPAFSSALTESAFAAAFPSGPPASAFAPASVCPAASTLVASPPLGSPSGRGTWGGVLAKKLRRLVELTRQCLMGLVKPFWAHQAEPRGVALVGASVCHTRFRWPACRGRAEGCVGMGRAGIDTAGAQGLDRGEVGLVLC